jgi:hypothetical protein
MNNDPQTDCDSFATHAVEAKASTRIPMSQALEKD